MTHPTAGRGRWPLPFTIDPVGALSALAVVAAPAVPAALRWLLLPCVLFVPGWMMLPRLFGSRRFVDDALTAVTAAILISVCIDSLIGLVSVLAQVPLTATAARVGLATITLAASTRRTSTAPADDLVRSVKWRSALRPATSIAVMLLVAWGAAVTLPRRPDPGFVTAAFTAGWELTSTAVTAGATEPARVSIRVENHDDVPVRLEPIARFDEQPESSAVRLRSVVVPAGNAIDVEFAVVPPSGACDARVRFSMGLEGGESMRQPLSLVMNDADADCSGSPQPSS